MSERMPNLLLIVLPALLSGCANWNNPISIDGNYYAAEQSDCSQFRYTAESQENAPVIECFGADGSYNGTNAGLTPEQLTAVREIAQLTANVLITTYQISQNDVALGHTSYQPAQIPFSSDIKPKKSATRLYSQDECIGSVVNGLCYGTVIPSPGVGKTCHGTVILGECHGSVVGD